MKISVYYKGLHWPHLLFFTLTPLVAIASGFWIGLNGGFHWGTVLLALAMLIFCGLSTTGGYHRLFAHKSYRAKWPVRLFFLLFGAAAFQGSARWWASGHRIHHKKTDTEQDPYGINKGFWFAHIGWLFTKDQEAPCDNVADLDKDFLIRWQARLFPLLAVGIGWFLPAAVASFWAHRSGRFFIAGIGRMVVNHHTTFCINSVCHYLGRRPYSDKHSARDSWISSLLTYGEGYHNFHHTFQYDYRNGIRFFHWDPTKWLIRFFQWTGLAQGLKKAREEKILLALVEMDSKRLALALAKKPPLLRQRFEEMVASTQIRVQESLIRFHQMKERLQEMKKDRLATWNHSMEEAREEYRLAKMEFQIALLQWRALVNGPLLA